MEPGGRPPEVAFELPNINKDYNVYLRQIRERVLGVPSYFC